MQGAEEEAKGSGRGEMAGLQMDTAVFPVLELGARLGPDWAEEGLNEPDGLGTGSGMLGSCAGEAFFLGGRGLDWPLLCCCCWRHLARRFLNQT